MGATAKTHVRGTDSVGDSVRVEAQTRMQGEVWGMWRHAAAWHRLRHARLFSHYRTSMTGLRLAGARAAAMAACKQRQTRF